MRPNVRFQLSNVLEVLEALHEGAVEVIVDCAVAAQHFAKGLVQR